MDHGGVEVTVKGPELFVERSSVRWHTAWGRFGRIGGCSLWIGVASDFIFRDFRPFIDP